MAERVNQFPGFQESVRPWASAPTWESRDFYHDSDWLKRLDRLDAETERQREEIRAKRSKANGGQEAREPAESEG